jgi:hypothetical protein
VVVLPYSPARYSTSPLGGLTYTRHAAVVSGFAGRVTVIPCPAVSVTTTGLLAPDSRPAASSTVALTS